MKANQSEAFESICQLLRTDLRFRAKRERLAERFPEYLPPDGSRLGSDVPIKLVSDMNECALSLGLGCLKAPWFVFFWILSEGVGHKSAKPALPVREADWFYWHYCEEMSVIQIAHKAFYSESTVRQGLTEIRRLLNKDIGRGRPPKWQQPKRSVNF